MASSRPTNVFVAPSFVIHYIDAHAYAPPISFREPMMFCREMRTAYFKVNRKQILLTQFSSGDDRDVGRQPSHHDRRQRLLNHPCSAVRRWLIISVSLTFCSHLVTKCQGGEFVRVELADFWQGAEANEMFARASEQPKFEVKQNHVLFVGSTEVTNAEFAEFADQSAFRTYLEKSHSLVSWRTAAQKNGKDCPVVNVTWNDCIAYCGWLSKQHGRHYRLLSESEWEYCCRKGTPAPANSLDSFRYAERFDHVGRIEDAPDIIPPKGIAFGTSKSGPLEVTKLPANELGIRGMLGNVAEWCLDDFRLYSRRNEEHPSSRAVLRGGSYLYGVERARATYRSWMHKTKGTSEFVGFRICYQDLGSKSD